MATGRHPYLTTRANGSMGGDGGGGTRYRDQLKPSRQAIDYLKRPGVGRGVAARFGLGYAPGGVAGAEGSSPTTRRRRSPTPAGHRFQRAGAATTASATASSSPIHDRRDALIAFGGRVLDKGELKYPELARRPRCSKGRELYGLFLAQKAIRDAGFAVVVGATWTWSRSPSSPSRTRSPRSAPPQHHLLRQTKTIVFFDSDPVAVRPGARSRTALESPARRRHPGLPVLPAEHARTPSCAPRAEAFRRAAKARRHPLGKLPDPGAVRRHPLDSAEGRAGLRAG